MHYQVRGLGNDGAILLLEIDARDERDASEQAASRGLAVLSVRRRAGVRAWFIARRARFPLLLFSQELLALLQSGVSLGEAIEPLAEKDQRPEPRKVLGQLITRLRQGQALSGAMQQSPDAFPPLYVAAMRAAERTGDVDEAGLATLPGTAAEILDDEIRAIICPDKINTQQWLDVQHAAHREGLRTTSTIMYGHVETTQHIAAHLELIRRLQGETGGFSEFVPLRFIHNNTALFQRGLVQPLETGAPDLRMYAACRLFFRGTIDNLQTSWVKLGHRLAHRAWIARVIARPGGRPAAAAGWQLQVLHGLEYVDTSTLARLEARADGGHEDDRELYLAWLRYLRGAVLRKVQDLTNEQARWRPDEALIPLLGIVNHLTHVEWRWIDGGMRGCGGRASGGGVRSRPRSDVGGRDRCIPRSSSRDRRRGSLNGTGYPMPLGRRDRPAMGADAPHQ